MNIVIPNEFSSIGFIGDMPPSSYEYAGIPKDNSTKYDNTVTYNKGEKVWTTVPSTSDNGSDNNYDAWYICNSNDTTDFTPYENPLYWGVIEPDNQTAFLDKYMDTQTRSVIDKTMNIVFNGGISDTACLFNVSAKKIFISSENKDFRLMYGLLSAYGDVINATLLASNQTAIKTNATGFKVGDKIKVFGGASDGSIFDISYINSDNTIYVSANINGYADITSFETSAKDFSIIADIDLKEDTSYWGISIEDIRFRKNIVINLPLTESQEYTLTLSNGDITTSTDTVGVGKFICGRIRNIGSTLYAPSVNLMTLSVKEKDSSGYSYYKKQNTYKEASYEVTIENKNRNLIYRLFEAVDAKDCVWIPDPNSTDSTINVFGCFSDFSLILDDAVNSTYNLSIEGTI